MRLFTLRKLLFNALVVFQISGCTPIPIPVEDPEILDKLSHIQPNVTTADEVRHILFRPRYVFPHERIWIYQDQAAHLVGIIPPVGVYADYITEVVFDEDGTVQRINTSVRDATSKSWGVHRDICLPSGICERESGLYRGMLASTAADAHVKSYSHSSNFCYVYLYAEDGGWDVEFSLNASVEFSLIGSGIIFSVHDKTFYYWELRPRTYNLGYGFVKPDKKYFFECLGGEAVFLRQGFTNEGRRWASHSPAVERVSEAVGRESINSRRLAANRYNPEFFERYGGENW